MTEVIPVHHGTIWIENVLHAQPCGCQPWITWYPVSREISNAMSKGVFHIFVGQELLRGYDHSRAL